jgi:4-hydroxybenzoate polyprenyltransferase/phosphoserine phosphatase
MQKSKLKPLVVDLDGSLIRSDLLHEAVWQTISRRPSAFIVSVLNFLRNRNKAKFKSDLSKCFELAPETLPYNEEVLKEIRAHRDAGGSVILASASHDAQVQSIARYLRVFDHAFGSSEIINFSGSKKAKAIQELLGTSDFIYIGNARADLKIWAVCGKAVLVTKSNRLESMARRINQDVVVLHHDSKSNFKTWLKQMRLYQWLKNVLIFVPVLAAYETWSLESAFKLFGAFIAFSFVASSVYIINDLFDLDNDRLHSTKRNRPIANGLVLPLHGLAFAVLLAFFGVAFGFFIQPLFGTIVAFYLCLTFAYSKSLKRIELVDAIVLALLYTVRVIAGGIVAQVPISYWLLSFSIFFFLSLSWVKRYAELHAGLGVGKGVAPGRAYTTKDLPIIQSFGIASGFLAILIFALYLDSPLVARNYATPAVAWLAIPILIYLLSRIWLLAQRGQVNEDPLTFVMTDKLSLLSIGLIGVTLFTAHIGVVF